MAMNPTTATLAQPDVVSRESWLAARQQLLRAEKELTHRRDELSRQRRALPWVKLEKDYVFEGPNGKVTLAGIFGDRSQLIVYHFMLGAGWEEGCKGCSFISDHFDGAIPHVNAKDIAFAVVSAAPLAELQPFQARMGWKFDWVSSAGSDFNRDFHVSFTAEEVASGSVDYNYSRRPFPVEEAPGLSVFARNAEGEIFHTYSTYGRGLEQFVGAYTLIDVTPQGRNEEPDTPMSWVRHHDRY